MSAVVASVVSYWDSRCSSVQGRNGAFVFTAPAYRGGVVVGDERLSSMSRVSALAARRERVVFLSLLQLGVDLRDAEVICSRAYCSLCSGDSVELFVEVELLELHRCRLDGVQPLGVSHG